ncbi:MAG: hypothetical protein ACHQ4G_09260 [Opitutales bacterium]
MKTRNLILLVGGLALWGVTSGQAFERVQQRTFTLPDAGTVKLDAYRGIINVVPGEGSTVQLTVRCLAGSAEVEKTRRELDALQIDAQLGLGVLVPRQEHQQVGTDEQNEK